MAIVKYLLSLALVLTSLPIHTFADDTPCLDAFTTLENFVDCLDDYTVPENFYTLETYTAAQPSIPDEMNAWIDAVDSLLTHGCTPGTLTAVSGLEDDYVIAGVAESDPAYTWCILVEKHTTATYKRGWGFVVTPADPAGGVHRDLHFSAPHPRSDSDTPVQAAALFKRTGAKSLVVTGRRRDAYLTSSLCSVATPPDIYYKTDSAHDDNEPFYFALAQVAAWQDANGGCPWETCAYLQIHGMRTVTCPDYNVFMSSGLGNSVSSESCYANTLLPITRLKQQLITTFPEYNISTPNTSWKCNLTATRNIFGRLVSGIGETDVCVNSGTRTRNIPCTCSDGRGCMGKFVHIEQHPDSRLPVNHERWANAISATFRPHLGGSMEEENILRVQ